VLDVNIKLLMSDVPNATCENYLFHRMPYMFEHFRFVYTDKPDYIIFFNRAQSVPAGSAVKIFYSQEFSNIDMQRYDWAVGFMYEEDVGSDRYIRIPNYVLYGGQDKLIKGPTFDPKVIAAYKTKFCAFVYYHNVPIRNELFRALSKYAQVDAPGKCMHNFPPLGGFATIEQSRGSTHYPEELVRFLSRYKFNIAFENTGNVGYTTEKIYLAMMANCIPIYFGNPTIGKEFNTNSFISVPNTDIVSTITQLVSRTIQIDKDPMAYLSMLQQPWYPNNVVNKYADKDRIIAFFKRMFTSKNK